MKKQQGFTLIEVMIALFIFALMMAVITSGLWVVIKSKERLEKQTHRIEQLQIAMLLISQDITQAVNRSIRDERGDVVLGFTGTLQTEPYLEFTRMGYNNPLLAAPRSSLQRVAYQFKNKQLARITWPVLDRAPTTHPVKHIILEDLLGLRIRYLAANNQFYNSWPPPIANFAVLQEPLPKAVDITFDFGNEGIINRLFVVGGSGFVD